MSIVRTFALTFASKGAGFVMTILTGILVSRRLLPEGKGQVDVIVMMTSLLVLLAYPSLEEPQLRHVGDGRPPGRLFMNAVLASLLFGVLVMLALELSVAWYPEWLQYRDRKTGATHSVDLTLLRMLTALAPLMVLQRLLAGLLQGLRAMRAFNGVHLIQNGTLLIAMVVLLLGFGGGVREAVYAHMMAYSIAASSALWLTFRRPEVRGSSLRPDLSGLLALIKDGARLHGGVVAAFVILQSDQLVLNRFGGPLFVGLYTTAVALTGHLRRVVLQPIKEVFGSRVPELMNDRERLLDGLETVCRHTLLLVAIPAFLLALFGWPIIRILYGTEFLPAYGPLCVLIPGSLFWSIAVMLSYWFIGTNRYLTLTAVGVFIAATNFVLNLIFVPDHGMIAAAWTSTFSYGLHMMIFTVFVARQGNRSARAFLIPRRSDLAIYHQTFAKIRGKLSTRRS